MNRSYKAGRHMLNAGELQSRILGKWADNVVQVVDLQGLDLRHQIALFQQTSILIWTHGAAMADLLFLPQVQLASNLPAKHVIVEIASSIPCAGINLSGCRESSCGTADVPAWGCLQSPFAQHHFQAYIVTGAAPCVSMLVSLTQLCQSFACRACWAPSSQQHRRAEQWNMGMQCSSSGACRIRVYICVVAGSCRH